MASIDKVPAGWRARWRTPDGRSRSKTFGRKVDAQRHLTSVEGSKLIGAYIDPGAGRVTFRQYAERWRLSQVHRETTAIAVETHLRRHAYPIFGDRPVASIRSSELQTWVKGRSEVLAPNGVKVVHQVVGTIFRAAVADRIIASSPSVGLKLPRVERVEVHPISPAEVAAMAAAVPPRYRALIVAGAGSGMRQGELLGLTVDRVDFLRRTIRVDRQMVTIAGRAPYLAPPKTDSSVRTIAAPSAVLEALSAHIAEFGTGDGGLIFTDEAGLPIRRPHAGHIWRKGANAAKVEGRSFHDLRHHCASVLIGAGSNVKVVQHHLGHASAKVTLDTYSHLWPDDEDRTRAALEAALRPVLPNRAQAADPKTGA
jgi:integrase